MARNVTRPESGAPEPPKRTPRGGRNPASGARALPVESVAGVDGGGTVPVKRVLPAYEQVAQQLRSLMISGELAPGQRLPSEADLAIMFGVGRTTLREGLRLLTSQQLLVTTRGVNGGTFVVTPDSDNISRYLETSIGLLTGANRLSINELLEARRYLEVPGAADAAERHGDDQLAVIRDSVLEGHAASRRMEHSNFHIAVLRASGNRMLEVMARPIFDVMRTRLNREAASREFWEKVATDHERIYSVIASRDAARTAQLMGEHLDHLAGVYTAIDVAAAEAASN